MTRARILLHAADGFTDEQIVSALKTGIAKIEWRFTTEDARRKLHRLYRSTSN